MILVIVVAIFELQQIILLTTANNAHAEWIIPSQLNEAYKNNTTNSTTSAVRGQNNQPTTNIITTENSSSAGK
jgi:hypothetical protein